jgi:hypothetical protein
MKGREKRQLMGLLETGRLCRENISIISLLPGMLRSVKKYDQVLLDLLESMFGQKETITHHAQEKLEARKKLAEHADYLSSLGYAYAYSIQSHLLMAQFNCNYSSVFRSRDTDVVPVCMHLYEVLREQQDKVKDWGIKKKDIEELLLLIQKFEKLMTVPRTYINRRMVETQNLRERLSKAGIILQKETDKLMVFFKSYTEFSEAYSSSRKQVKEKVTEEVLEKKVKEFYLAPKVMRRKGVRREMVGDAGGTINF